MCIKMLHFSKLVCVLFPNLPDLTYGMKLVLLSEVGSLFINLFYNAISVTRLYSIDEMVMNDDE
jgi:hypothetical protein